MSTKIDLPVSGMSCAACARTIEKGLAATPGVVHASVNFATSTATVDFDPRQAAPQKLAGVIEGLGYHVPAAEESTADLEEQEYRAVRRRFLAAAALGAPVAVLGMDQRVLLAPGL